jgi:N-acyl-L-homoserine lactone synthetase
MIRFFQGRDRAYFPNETNEMFQLRKRQFLDRLKWNVVVRDGWEIDEFDEMNPLYLVCWHEQSSAIAGSLRFLPTTGPTMMKAVFDRYFDEPFGIETPLMWECTRFAIEPGVTKEWLTPTGLCRATFELMQGGCEVATIAGIEQIVGIFDTAMLRIYRRVGWCPEIIASTERLGDQTIHVGLWAVNDASLTAMRERSGIKTSVLDQEMATINAVA